MINLRNKNIIVTGATGGIGNSIIKKLNEYGANILASGTKSEKLEDLKKRFSNLKLLKFDITQDTIFGKKVGAYKVTGKINDVALTEEEEELVQRAVSQRLASTLQNYENTKKLRSCNDTA